MKTALVFSGGGARGSYEVGVWKALDELKIKCDIVTGVSIGSINAALYTEKSLKKAIKLWENINYNTVFSSEIIPTTNRETIKKYLKALKNGGLEPSNLKNNLSKYINLNKIYKSNLAIKTLLLDQTIINGFIILFFSINDGINLQKLIVVLII